MRLSFLNLPLLDLGCEKGRSLSGHQRSSGHSVVTSCLDSLGTGLLLCDQPKMGVKKNYEVQQWLEVGGPESNQ